MPTVHASPDDQTAADIVVTLVHGTFSPRAEWTLANSTFSQRVAEQLGAELQVRFRRIEWRGLFGSFLNNGHGYRIAAGVKLAESLKASFAESPQAEHWVIAHSHGGNVAMYALRDETVARRLNGIVTIATPFIACSPRDIADPALKVFMNLFSGVLAVGLLIGFIAFGLYVLHLNGTSLNNFMLFTVLAVSGVAGSYVSWGDPWLRSRFPVWQAATIARLELPKTAGQRVLCQSIHYDEAGILLKGMYRIAALPHWLWDGVVYLPMFMVVLLLAAIFGDSLFASMAGKVGWDRLGGAFSAALGFSLVVASCHAFIMTVVPRFTRALGIGFGQESFVDNLLVDIRSSVTPPNAEQYTWTKYLSARGGWLRHSRLYQNADSVDEIARFIAR